MRFILLFLPLLLLAQPLPLSVKYDPFGVTKSKKSAILHKDDFTTRKEIVLRLTAIYNGRALINGQLVGPGEEIGGFRVENIADGRVVLIKGRTKKILYFSLPIIKMERQ